MPTSPSAPSSPSAASPSAASPSAASPSAASPSAAHLVPRHDRFADGSVKASGFELDGKLHGHWEWFRIDGSLMRSGEFDLGNQVGLWRTWDRAGHLVTETSFDRARSADPAAPSPTPTPGSAAPATSPQAAPDPADSTAG